MIIILMTFLGVFFDRPSDHERINNRFSREISKNIQQQWNVCGGMNGGKLNPTLENVSYNFDYYNGPCIVDKDAARRLYIDVVEYILYAYNTNSLLKDSLSNYPYEHRNINAIINLVANEGRLGEIECVKGFKDRVIFSYVTKDLSYITDVETFEEAYFKVRGRAWDPFQYGIYRFEAGSR